MSVQTGFPAYWETAIVWMSEKHGVSIVSWSNVLQGLQWGWFLLAGFHNSWVLWGQSCLQKCAKQNCSRCPNGNAWQLAEMPSPYMPNTQFLQLPSTCALPVHKICFLSFRRIRTICVPARFSLVLNVVDGFEVTNSNLTFKAILKFILVAGSFYLVWHLGARNSTLGFQKKRPTAVKLCAQQCWR